jgi:hypothetical protein
MDRDEPQPPFQPIIPPDLSPPAPAIADLFDPDTDLYTALKGRCEWYTMPNGKRVCVHPMSGEEAIWAQRQVLRELRAEGLLADKEQSQTDRGLALSEGVIRGYVWTTIAVCRTGEELPGEKVFKPKHADALRKNPGWAEATQAISQIAERLASGESEAETLRRMLGGFFGQLGSWLETTLGPNGADRTSSHISRFVSSASSAKPPETRLAELTRLLSAFPAE